VDDTYVSELADAVTGALGGKSGVAPRLFLKKLIADVLDRVDQFPDFDPRRHYKLTLATSELSEQERNAAAATLSAVSRAGDIDLDLP
jgi:BREX system ATP-binding protein BrxC/D